MIDDATRNAAVVDPAEEDKVIRAAEREGVLITAIWTTHGHWDHVGGNEGLARTVGGLRVYGPEGAIRRKKCRYPKMYYRTVSRWHRVCTAQRMECRH